MNIDAWIKELKYDHDYKPINNDIGASSPYSSDVADTTGISTKNDVFNKSYDEYYQDLLEQQGKLDAIRGIEDVNERKVALRNLEKSNAERYAKAYQDYKPKMLANPTTFADKFSYLTSQYLNGLAAPYAGMAGFVHADSLADEIENSIESYTDKNPIVLKDDLSNLGEYLTNVKGAGRSFAKLLGSMTGLAPVGMLGGEYAIGGEAVANIVSKIPYFSKLSAPMQKAIIDNAKWMAGYGTAKAVPEAISEGGNVRRDLLKDNPNDINPDLAAWETALLNYPMLAASDILEGANIFKGAGVIPLKYMPSPIRNSALGRGITAPLRGLPSASLNSVQQSLEEAAQEGISSFAKDEDYGILPWNWSEKQKEAFYDTLIPSLFLGGVTGTGHALADSNTSNSSASSSDVLTSDAYRKQQEQLNKIILQGAKQPNTPSMGNTPKGNVPQGTPVTNDAVESAVAPFLGVRMDNGANGCVEAVTKIGAKMGSPFLTEQLRNGVVYVQTLVKNAGDRVIPFDASKLEAGDIIVYGDDDHVVMFDGKGGYVGNSSSQQKVVHGSDYNSMDDLEPTKIIKTDTIGGGAPASTGGVDISNRPGGHVAQLISERTGIPADWIWAQMAHETGNFSSDLAREDHNYGGIKENREGHQGVGKENYRHFDSDEEYADYAAKNLNAYTENGIKDAKTIEEFAKALKDGGYYEDSLENYTNGLKNALGGDSSVKGGNMSAANAVGQMDDTAAVSLMDDFIGEVVTGGQLSQEAIAALTDSNGHFVNNAENRAALLDDNEELFREYLSSIANASDAELAKRVAGELSKAGDIETLEQVQQAIANGDKERLEVIASGARQTANRLLDTIRSKKGQDSSIKIFNSEIITDIINNAGSKNKNIKGFYNDFIQDRISSIDDTNEINELSSMLNVKGKFQNTPENRKALAQKYKNEIADYYNNVYGPRHKASAQQEPVQQASTQPVQQPQQAQVPTVQNNAPMAQQGQEQQQEQVNYQAMGNRMLEMMKQRNIPHDTNNIVRALNSDNDELKVGTLRWMYSALANSGMNQNELNNELIKANTPLLEEGGISNAKNQSENSYAETTTATEGINSENQVQDSEPEQAEKTGEVKAIVKKWGDKTRKVMENLKAKLLSKEITYDTYEKESADKVHAIINAIPQNYSKELKEKILSEIIDVAEMVDREAITEYRKILEYEDMKADEKNYDPNKKGKWKVISRAGENVVARTTNWNKKTRRYENYEEADGQPEGGFQNEMDAWDYAKKLNEQEKTKGEESTKAVEEKPTTETAPASQQEKPAKTQKNSEKTAKEQLEEAKAERMELLQPVLDIMDQGMGNGVKVVPLNDGSRRGARESQNASWYQKWSKEHNYKKMSKAEKEAYAEDVLRGKEQLDNFTFTLASKEEASELDKYYKDNAAKLDELNARIKSLKEAAKNEKNSKVAASKGNTSGVTEVVANDTTKKATNEGGVKLAEGYTTESGRPLQEADKNEFILNPNGEKDIITFSKEIENKTNGQVKSVPVRLQVGFSRIGDNGKETGMGMLHIKKHESQFQQNGFKNAEEYIKYVLNNFDKIVKSDRKGNRLELILDDKHHNVMPIDLELERGKNGFYTVVSAIIKRVDTKIEGEVIYDRSASLSSATSNGVAQNGANSDNAGAVAQSATNKFTSPSLDSNISQEQEEGNNVKESIQNNSEQKESAQEQAKTEETKNTYNGFTDTLPANQQARAQKTLSVEVDDVDGKKVTRAEYVEKAVADGRPVHKVENGKNTEYRIYTGDDTNGYAKVTKTEYDYAMFLGAKTLDAETPAETEAKAEEKAKSKTKKGITNKKGSKKSSDKLEDFGEHLEGAKKDYYASYKDKLEKAKNASLDDVPFSKWWAEPDYAKLIDSGVNREVVDFIRALRDLASEVMPNKKSYKFKMFKPYAETLKKFMEDCFEQNKISDVLERVLSKPEYVDLRTRIEFKQKLYEALGHEASLRGHNVDVGTNGTYFYYPRNSDEVIEFKATRDKPVYRLKLGQISREFLNNHPELKKPSYDLDELVDLAAKAIKATQEVQKNISAEDKNLQKFREKVSAGQLRGASTYIVYVKWGSGGRWSILADGFEKPEDARNYIDEHLAELQEKYEELKKTPGVRGLDNSARIGKDYRNGKDVTPEQFTEAFGFRGVQFGNWVKNAKRQQDLNEAFDALMDLADVLGISPRALSFGGELGLAFGARGSGGANAHYEPSTFVINLTNTRGAGSLAHEWFHALDNYLTKTHRTLKPSNMTNSYSSEARKEVEEAFRALRKAFNETGYADRSAKVDLMRSDDYWSRPHEMGARAFEAYIIYKLKQTGNQNDYLANVIPQNDYDNADRGNKGESRYPYPTESEMENNFAKAFDNLFTVLDEKSEGGNVVLYSLSDSSVEAMSPEDFEQAVKDEFSYAKDFTKDGNVISFVLPNGKKIHVDLVNRIAFTDEDKANAEKAYGRDVKDNEAPEGAYTNAGEEGFISVARTGNKGAVSHEAYHVAREFLSDKAKAFLSGKFKNEEVEAEAYRKWRDSRNRDGMFGKIWQQIKDVASSFANVLGIQTEHEVFRQIESGEVYENTAVNGKPENIKYSLTAGKQLEEVRKQYEGTDQWMKAPNGKPTNLTERQWLQVRTPNFKNWFGDWENDPENASKIVDENGEPMVMYHGTPLGGFEEFNRELNYFTPDKEYADRYQDPGASSDYVKGVHEELGKAMTYPVFLNIRKPFDTRKAKERKIFEKEFYRQWGNGAPLSEKGLPDWTDSDDFREFFEENDYDYDGLLLDEGGVPTEDGNVKSRGISYVAFKPNQIKSATDNTGAFSKDSNNIKLSVSEIKKQEKINQKEQLELVKTEFPTAKNIKQNGDEISFDYNYQRVRVNFVDKLIMTERDRAVYREDYGKGYAGETVLGKVETINGEQVITLLKTGPKDTISHEAFHLAFRTVLTRDQRKFLVKQYGSEEKAAEAYRELMNKGRTRKSMFDTDTNVGRLFQKIYDFANSIFKVFALGSTQYDAESIMYAIADGSIYDLNGGKQGQSAFIHPAYLAAWHGSPHLFDKFSTDSIGSGQGAIAHGWGLYFALNKKVSERYKYELTNKTRLGVSIDGKQYYKQEDKEGDEENWVDENGEVVWNDDAQFADWFAENEYDKRKTIEALNAHKTASNAEYIQRMLSYFDKHDVKRSEKGALYQVDIPSTDTMLREDKPFSEQPKQVQDALEKMWKEYKDSNTYSYKQNDDKYDIYRGDELLDTYDDEELAKQAVDENTNSTHIKKLSNFTNGREILSYVRKNLYSFTHDYEFPSSDKGASLWLNKYGIEGISYHGGQDGECCVVFSDKAVKILERNGEPIESKPSFSVSENVAADQRSTEEIKQDIISALPKSAKVEDHGDTMTIHMPNDVTVDIEVVDNVSVTDAELEQARKEHGIGKDVNITVNGKFQVTGAKRALISLARNGKKGTAYHEIVHLAYELALTKEQKQGLNIVYGAQAKAAGKDIEEFVADKMRDDAVSKRKLPKGLKKAYEAINDMIDKLKRAILGQDTSAYKTMRDIETGKVFENSVDKSEKADDNVGKEMVNKVYEAYLPDSRDQEGGFNTEDQLWQEVNEAYKTGTVDRLIKRKCARFNVEKECNNVEAVDRLAAEINFVGRCIKYVDRYSKVPNWTKTGQRNQSGGSKETLENVASRSNRGTDTALGRGDYLDSVTRDKILSIEPDPIDNKAVEKRYKELEDKISTLNKGAFSFARTYSDDKVTYTVKMTGGDSLDAENRRVQVSINDNEAKKNNGKVQGEQNKSYVFDNFNDAFNFMKVANQKLNEIADDQRVAEEVRRENNLMHLSISPEQEQAPQSFLEKTFKSFAKNSNIKGDKIIVEQQDKDGEQEEINLKNYIFSSPSRIAEKVGAFKYFYTIGKRAMDVLTQKRSYYERKLNKAFELVPKEEDYKTLNDILVDGDVQGKEWTKAELIADGVKENVAEAYVQIRKLMDKAYRDVNEARRRPQVHTINNATEKQIQNLRGNDFVDILSIKEDEDGHKKVTYKEYANWERTYTVDKETLDKYEKDPAIQVLETKKEGDDTYTVKVREAIPPVNKLTGYIPHFFHNYMVRLVDKDGHTIKDENGNPVILTSGRTEREAVQKAEEWLKNNQLEDGQTIHIAPKIADFTSLGMDEGQYAAVMGDKDYYRMMNNIAKQNDMTLQEAKEMLDGSVRKKGRHRFFGNLMQRKGVKGYEENMGYILRHYFNSASRYYAMETEFKPKAISMYERLYGDFSKDAPNKTADYTKDYINDINGNPTTLEKAINDALNKSPIFRKYVASYFGERAALQLASNISSATSSLCLGFLNASSALLNLTQLINTAAYLNDFDALGRELVKGYRRKFNLGDLRILHETNVLNDIGLDSGSGYDMNRMTAKNILGKLNKGGMVLFKATEAYCRCATVLAAYKSARKKGKSHNEAIEYAKEINQKSNFDYGAADAPNIFRRGSILSQLMLQFQKYGIKELEVMGDMLPWNKSTNGKQKAIFWGLMLLACGLLQWPGEEFIDNVFFDGKLRPKMKAWMMEAAGDSPMGKALAEFAMYGLAAPITGIDISSRAGLADVIPSRGRDLGGPAFTRTVSLAADLFQGKWADALRDFSPGLYNQYAAWFAGQSTGTRGRVNNYYDSFYDKLLRAMGFKSVDESIDSDIQRITSIRKKEATEEKQRAIDDYIADPSTENYRRLVELGVKAKTVQEERKKKKMDRLERIQSGMSKNDKKGNSGLIKFAE